MKKFNLKLFIVSLAIPLLVGGIATLIIMNQLGIYSQINVPQFAPPSQLFGIVWTILYILMGVSLYLVLSNTSYNDDAVFYFGLQLALNFIWPILFFNFQLFWLSFVVIVLMLILIVVMIVKFYHISKVAAFLQIPYLLWTIFATVLNLAIALLN